jgi:hypothetical protein
MVSNRFDALVDEKALESDGLGFLTVVGGAIRRFENEFGSGLVVLERLGEVSLLVLPFSLFDQFLTSSKKRFLKKKFLKLETHFGIIHIIN